MDILEGHLIYAEGELNQLKNDADALPNDENANGCCHAAQRATELYEELIASVRTYVNNNHHNIVINHVPPHAIVPPPGPPGAAPAAGGKRDTRKRGTRKRGTRKRK
jgi:hypothetical protein